MPSQATNDIVVSTSRGDIPTRVTGTGKPLVMLHGYPLDGRMWGTLTERLSDRYLCIVPDQRGFGRSHEASRSFSMADLADDCAALLDALQIRQPVVLCGLSMGGYVAMEFVQRHRDRVAQLLLVNTRANADDEAAAAGRRAAAAQALREGTESVVTPMLEKLLAPSTISDRRDIVELVQSMMLSTRPSTIAWAQLAMALRNDFLEPMKQWKLRTLCFAGSDDRLITTNSVQQMAQAIPDAEYVEVEGAGHLIPLEAPDAIVSKLTSDTIA